MTQLFVYGSLRKGMYNHEPYLKQARFIGYARTRGSLYALRDVAYPALLEGDDWVLGEVYEVLDEDVAKIDQLEGCETSTFGEYQKVLLSVELAQEVIPVYGYVFNRQKVGAQQRIGKPILDGDFVSYVKTLSK